MMKLGENSLRLFEKDIIHGILPSWPYHCHTHYLLMPIHYPLIFDINYGGIKYSVSIQSARNIGDFSFLIAFGREKYYIKR